MHFSLTLSINLILDQVENVQAKWIQMLCRSPPNTNTSDRSGNQACYHHHCRPESRTRGPVYRVLCANFLNCILILRAAAFIVFSIFQQEIELQLRILNLFIILKNFNITRYAEKVDEACLPGCPSIEFTQIFIFF